MELSREQLCLLGLSAAEITADRVHKLKAEFGSAQGIWEAFAQERIPTRGKAAEKLKGLQVKGALEAYVHRTHALHMKLLFLGDEEYPEALSQIDDPPYVLYYAGDIAALHKPMVAVVGSRVPSRYGREMAGHIAQELAEAGICIVSGLARGIDSCAHEGALRGQGITAAVLGSGLNVPYPPENTAMLRKIALSGGVVLSEYPLDADPATYHFPHRNRVISGLSQALIFVEGKVKSGGMLTVSSALAQGREVFAVPGQVGHAGAEGPHTIIREGARLVTSAQDVLDDLNLPHRQFSQCSRNLQPENDKQRDILSALARESLTLEGLSTETGLATDVLITELSMMEVMGQITRERGNFFSLAR